MPTRSARPAPAHPNAPAGSDEPAQLVGYGPIPAATARRLVFGPSAATPMWLRRLFTRPADGQLAAMDSRRRYFTAGQRLFLQLRDHTCRQPWCDAPIRHADHVVPAKAGGPTSVDNGQGNCASCNFAKQAPAWRTKPGVGGEILITTPTGHVYRSRAPDPPGTRSMTTSRVELRFRRLLLAA